MLYLKVKLKVIVFRILLVELLYVYRFYYVMSVVKIKFVLFQICLPFWFAESKSLSEQRKIFIQHESVGK